MANNSLFEFDPDNPEAIRTRLNGLELLYHPFLNKGSAFSNEERAEFGLTGLLPYHANPFETQLARSYANFLAEKTPIEKHIFLAALHDRNEVLFFKLIQDHMSEMVPIVYTPTVGEACQRYSHIFRRARGLYLSYPDRAKIDEMLRNIPQNVEIIVVTDGERILGLGDLGVGGMSIPIGKLALYTLCAGIHPLKTLPILLDAGTNNPELLKDPLYLGWRNPRLERAEYDSFVDLFVQGVKKRWPHVILQWEDFSKNNAWRLLQRYKDEIATFNDDIQGTAAVTVAGILRAMRVAGRSFKDEKIVILGAGSAATGIAALIIRAMRERKIKEEDAAGAIWLLDTKGLVHQGRSDLSDEKKPFAQKIELLKKFGLEPGKTIGLEDVVDKVSPTCLIGTSGQPGIFTEAVVRSMAARVERPVIFPLSNPTSKSEATPEQLLFWSQGKALVATGSPFPPVVWKGEKIPIGQCNNAFIFPGVGLGLASSGASRVPSEVFLAAAETLANFDERLPGYEQCLFPNLELVRKISERIAIETVKTVLKWGDARKPMNENEIPDLVRRSMWNPAYPKLIRAEKSGPGGGFRT